MMPTVNESFQTTRADAEIVYVGKRAGNHTMRQEDINALLVKSLEGKLVPTLKRRRSLCLWPRRKGKTSTTPNCHLK